MASMLDLAFGMKIQLVTYFVYVYYLSYMEIMFFYEMVLLYLHVESQLKYVKPQMNPTKITSY
jgi:hypothetical protein